MIRNYWTQKTNKTKANRIILSLPAPIKEQLEDKGVIFESKCKADYRLVGKEVRIKFLPKEKEETDNDQ
jgi:hypothetical protein